MKGMTGTAQSYFSVAYPMSGLVRNIAHQIKEKRVEIKEKGKGRPIRIPDETVLEIRRLHEIEGLSQRQIERRYPDMRPDTIRQFIQYQTRCNLQLPNK